MIPDLNPETVSWETFGFPDPTFIPHGYGFFALLWALKEREIFFSTTPWGEAFSAFVTEPSAWRGLQIISAADVYSDIDSYIYSLSDDFLHPDRREAYLRGALSKDDAAWNIKELMTAAAGGDTSAIIGWTDDGSEKWTYQKNHNLLGWRFTPKYYLPWLLQRYNAVNLLRYAVPRHFCKTEVISGVSTWGERFTSLDAAIASAIANKETHTSTGWTDPMLQYTYRDPSWGANAGYGNVRFQQLNRVYVDLPSGVTNWTGFMGADFWIPDGCLAPPNYPGAGYSRIASDGNGDFLAAPFPFWTGTTLPTEQSVEYALGMYGEPRFYFDLYPQFHFKPEE